MTLTKNEINRILETLPVGFYAKTKINVECVDGSQSYYDESAEKIVVGVDTINMGLAKVADDFDTAVAVRTVFYHEVSHLILTPISLIKNPRYYSSMLADKIAYYLNISLSSQEAFDLINIVEDERIESALRNFYLNTNFRWFVTQQYNGQPFVTAQDIFYAAVRFRMGDEKILKAVSDLIIKFKWFTRDSYVINRDNNRIEISEYIADIAKLYVMCVQKNNENQQQKNNSTNNNKEQNKNNTNQQQKENNMSEPSSENQCNDSQTDDGSDVDDEIEDISEDDAENKSNNINQDNPDNMDNCHPDEAMSSDEIIELAAKIFDKFQNFEMTNEFRRIFKQFKTRGNVGGHTNAYSGVIDPRNAARKDYRYFTRINTENNGGAGKLHLNLWIDCSGSYSSNELITNQIIKALEIVERENKIFTFDVMDINDGVNIHPKNKRYIKASGGNCLCEAMDTTFKAMQKPDARNYNIVLYDGIAYRSGEQKMFSAWNHDNVFIISDTDNERPIKANCKKAKTMFVHWSCGKSYATLLGEKIYSILRVGFGA